MNRRRFLRSALAGTVAYGATLESLAATGSSGQGQTPMGVTGIDYFPVYYAWYSKPERWLTNPDYSPALGKYRSDQTSVIARHFDWLQANGGAGFTINWHGAEGFINDTVEQRVIPEISNHPGQEFCIHYDPFIRWGLPMPDFTTDAAARQTWRDDARHIARSFMPHPQYARVGAKPLLFVYLTRAIEGLSNLQAFVEIARQEAAAAGHSGIYLVLGEAWWIPTNEHPINIEIIRSRRAPRTRVGDAVFSYNLATEPVHELIWKGNIRTYLGEAQRVYKDYRNLMDERGAADKAVITTLMPRFDNTVLRVLEGGDPGMNIGPWQGYSGHDFEEDVSVVLDKLTPSFEPLRGTRTIMVVTSWNEWPERSALEPSTAGIDKDGIAAPLDDYLVGLGRAVAAFPRPNAPILRPGSWFAPAERFDEGAEELLEAIDVGVDMAGLTAAQTERVTQADVSGARVPFRALLAAGRG